MRDEATAEPPESFDALKGRLIEIEPNLPKRLRQAAAYALEHPDEFALGTASAIARNADVQASTLVRFAQTLGFGGFSDLQEVFRSHLRNRWPDYSERLKTLHETARDSGDPTDLLAGFAELGRGLDRSPARRRSVGASSMRRSSFSPAPGPSIASASVAPSASPTTSPMRWPSSAFRLLSSTMSAASARSSSRGPARMTR